MNYDRLIKIIEDECERRKLSYYQLSELAGLPKSTVYGILKRKNKAQIDTLCVILEVLDLRLDIISLTEEKRICMEEDWLVKLQGLSFEKKTVIKKLVLYLED